MLGPTSPPINKTIIVSFKTTQIYEKTSRTGQPDVAVKKTITDYETN